MYLHLQFKKNIFDALQTIRSRKGYAGNKRKKYNSMGWKWVQYLHRAKKIGGFPGQSLVMNGL